MEKTVIRTENDHFVTNKFNFITQFAMGFRETCRIQISSPFVIISQLISIQDNPDYGNIFIEKLSDGFVSAPLSHSGHIAPLG
jgi:hypothetical protein